MKKEKFNIELILTLLDIGYCPVKYNYKEGENVTKELWSKVMEQPVFKNIFGNFKPETLRKYFSFLSKDNIPNKVHKYIELIDKYKSFLNNPKIRLVTAIWCISSFFANNKTNFKE